MPIQLNHTFVWCKDNVASSAFITRLFGLPDAYRYGPFMVVDFSNDVSLDYHSTDEPIRWMHYAFLVTEDDFDDILGRITGQGVDYWADAGLRRQGEINHDDGGRGLYFRDLDGHILEIITRPYGSGD